MDHEGSDVDRRGFYLPPADLHWSLAGVPDQIESDEEECYWELEKFLRLALKANPNILECLYSPLVEVCTPPAQEMIDMREAFLSRHIHRTYNSYVLSQFKKMEQDPRNGRALRWKHVMHLSRLLLSGVVVLRQGFVPLRVEEHRQQLLSIRRGEIPWEDVEAWRLRLHRELDQAHEETASPEHPDAPATGGRFRPPDKYTFGNGGSNIMRLPAVHNWDISLFLDVRVREKWRAQVRWETYNTFNHTQFSNLSQQAKFQSVTDWRQVDPLFLQPFLQPTSARQARTMQLALRLNF